MLVMDRKMAVLEAAKRSFSEFGYKATTMERVAQSAGVAKGTIYTFFPTKEALFETIVDDVIRHMLEVIDPVLKSPRPLAEVLHEALYSLLTFRKEHVLLAKLTEELKTLGTPETKVALSRVEQAIVCAIQNRLDEGIRAGEIKPLQSELLAFSLLKLYRALIVDWEKHHPPLSDEEIATFFYDFVIKGIQQSTE
ncbi:MAG: TetR/AcrR family transcriptional regulator [Candidatus Carbobacillus sp.]|nr:TetR/AcrR family transcriptional regulator [Candidatus Carbobacillus sp.]